MLNKAVQQGRRRIETGGGTDHTSWGRSPIQWILANGKTPPALPPSENLNRYVEDLDEPRTKLADFFSILLDTDKLIRLLLQPDFGLRSMPRHHNRGVLQGVQPLSNGLLDGFEVSTPEIGAPDAAAKECVAG